MAEDESGKNLILIKVEPRELMAHAQQQQQQQQQQHHVPVTTTTTPDGTVVQTMPVAVAQQLQHQQQHHVVQQQQQQMDLQQVQITTAPAIFMSLEQTAELVQKDQILKELSLTFVQLEDWLVIQRSRFEIRLNEEPFKVMEFYFQPRTGRYYQRVFGKTMGTVMQVQDVDSFVKAVSAFFSNTLPCIGAFGPGGVPSGFQQVTYPFSRHISKECQYIYRKDRPNNVIGLCDSCLKVKANAAAMTLPDPPLKKEPEVPAEGEEGAESTPLSASAKKAKAKKAKKDSLPLRRHGEKKSIACPHEGCIAQLKSRQTLARHRREIHFFGEYQCRLCGEKAEYATEFYDHFFGKHEETEEKFLCPCCGDPYDRGQAEDFKEHYSICCIASNDTKTNSIIQVAASGDPDNPTLVKIEQPMQCPLPHCGQILGSVQLMQAHIKIKHLRGDFRCIHCLFRITHADDLYNHYYLSHKDKDGAQVLVCPTPKCSSTFKARGQIRDFVAHFLQCSSMVELKSGGLIKQKKAGYLFQLKTLGVFQNRPPIEKKFICDMCGKGYPSRTFLQDHIAWHNGEKPFKCDFQGCDFATHSRGSLQMHAALHLRDTEGVTQVGSLKLIHPCDKCERVFKFSESLKYHKRHVHDGIKEQFACQDCGQTYATVRSLRRHRQSTHDSTGLIGCGICGKTFGANWQLQQHMSFVHAEQKYQCKDCGKAFTVKHRLIEHERIHTGETPFACEFCGHKTKSSSVLAKHKIAKHKDEIAKSKRKQVGTVVST